MRLVFTVVFATGCATARGNPVIPSCYRADVDTVVAQGRYVPETHYVAPGFGESPATDARVRVAMLELSQPLVVCPTAVSGKASKSIRFPKVQLNLPSGWVPPNTVRMIHVSGYLAGNSAPGEFTSVVINVRRVTGLPGMDNVGRAHR